MADYKEKFSENKKFEMVHISLEDEGDHEEWAKAENFPWLTINRDEVDEDLKKLGGGYVPSYVMVDLAGNVIAKGKSASFAKLKE